MAGLAIGKIAAAAALTPALPKRLRTKENIRSRLPMQTSAGRCKVFSHKRFHTSQINGDLISKMFQPTSG